MFSFFLNWFIFKASSICSFQLSLFYDNLLHVYNAIWLYTTQGNELSLQRLLPIHCLFSQASLYAFLQWGGQCHTNIHHDVRLLGKPYFAFGISLLSISWYFNMMLKVPAHILGPWGKGQENYKQPWHFWTAKPTEATAYCWTPRYTRQINTHVFQPL